MAVFSAAHSSPSSTKVFSYFNNICTRSNGILGAKKEAIAELHDELTDSLDWFEQSTPEAISAFHALVGTDDKFIPLLLHLRCQVDTLLGKKFSSPAVCVAYLLLTQERRATDADWFDVWAVEKLADPLNQKMVANAFDDALHGAPASA